MHSLLLLIISVLKHAQCQVFICDANVLTEIPYAVQLVLLHILIHILNYSMEQRPEVLKEQPSLKVTEVSKVLGERY
jgi:HMG (high mobility group) box